MKCAMFGESPVVRIDVWDRPGMGIDFIPDAARQVLSDEDRDFFA